MGHGYDIFKLNRSTNNDTYSFHHYITILIIELRSATPLILPPALPLVGKPSVMPSNSHKIEKAPTDKQACRWHFPIL